MKSFNPRTTSSPYSYSSAAFTTPCPINLRKVTHLHSSTGTTQAQQQQIIGVNDYNHNHNYDYTAAFHLNHDHDIISSSTLMMAQQQQQQQQQQQLLDPSIVTTTTTQQTFDAVAPDTSTLIGFGIVLFLSIVAANVWANDVVPVSRTKLAISKRDGEVKQYLDELREGGGASASTSTSSSSSSMSTTTTTDTDALVNASASSSMLEDQNSETITMEGIETIQKKTMSTDGKDFERWLFTDWLESNKSAGGKGGRKKEPALPILKNAKWNSGDNPVVVTAAIMMVGIVIASVTERVGGTSF